MQIPSQGSRHRLPDAPFYANFYKEFYSRFEGFDDLPDWYLEEKSAIAKDILAKLRGAKRLLSIGCGNGLIEKYIVERSDVRIDAMEVSLDSARWLEGVENITLYEGVFPQGISNPGSYDLVYGSNVDYLFDNKGYVEFLRTVYDAGVTRFLLHQMIVDPSDLQVPLQKKAKQSVGRVLTRLGLYEKGRLWGYRRTIEEHLECFKHAGFSNMQWGCVDGSHWMMCGGV